MGQWNRRIFISTDIAVFVIIICCYFNPVAVSGITFKIIIGDETVVIDNPLISVTFGDGWNPSPLGEAKFSCRKATCHSGPRAGIQAKGVNQFWMPVADPVFSGDQVQHDGLGNSGLKKVDFNQLTLEPLVLQTRVVQLMIIFSDS